MKSRLQPMLGETSADVQDGQRKGGDIQWSAASFPTSFPFLGLWGENMPYAKGNPLEINHH